MYAAFLSYIVNGECAAGLAFSSRGEDAAGFILLSQGGGVRQALGYGVQGRVCVSVCGPLCSNGECVASFGHWYSMNVLRALAFCVQGRGGAINFAYSL